MTKTVNAFIADQGEVAITLSAANITAIAAFTTAEEIVIDGAVVSFKRTNDPELPFVEEYVTGDDDPIILAGKQSPAEMWELILIDDYHEGAAGEWGTDNLAAVEIFEELRAARQHPSAFQCTPAGGATGDIETTLETPKIVAVGQPEIDANSNQAAKVRILIRSANHSNAAHA